MARPSCCRRRSRRPGRCARNAEPTGNRNDMSKLEIPRPAPPGARIPVKLHRRVCLIQTEDAVLAEELLARKKLSQDLVGRLTDRVLLIRPGRAEAIIAELQKMGHTPQVSTKSADGESRGSA